MKLKYSKSIFIQKNQQAYQKVVAELEQLGLNLCASFDVDSLPESMSNSMPDNAQQEFKSLLLVGTKGSGFWQHLRRINKTDGHCFDDMSQILTEQVLSENFPQAKILSLYPHKEYIVPLQQLGHLVGWGRPSVLGLDINPEYGTWFAYRTALLVSEAFPASEHLQTEEVCETCIDKPCRTACPVGAVKTIGKFDIKTCIENRIQDNSPCADRCLARLACPVGKDYFYQPDHLAHHSHYSLVSIKHYLENNKW